VAASTRNIVSGNTNLGVNITGDGNVLQGNYIGLSPNGAAALTNGNMSLQISSANNTIGGGGAGNVIAGAAGRAVTLTGATCTGNAFYGNTIGSNVGGSLVIASGSSTVAVISAAASNIFGSSIASLGNTIRGSTGGAGIASDGTLTIKNKFSGNSIYGNATFGIRNAGGGRTPNDGLKDTTKVNYGMDYPIFTSVVKGSGIVTVAGYVGTAGGQTAFGGATVEVFIASTTDGTGFGSGQTYLGTLTAAADGTFSGAINTGANTITTGSTVITSTATDATGNTSEFGANITVA